MTTEDLIDRVMLYTDQVPPADADASTRRDRILQWLREVSEEVWNYRDWPWKLAQDSITMSGEFSADLPPDFSHFPEDGGVYDSSTGLRLEELPVRQVFDLLETGTQLNPSPYAVIWRNTSTSMTQLQLTRQQTVDLLYAMVPPAFDGEEDNDLEKSYPVQYHHIVFLSGVVAKARKAKGDSAEWRRRFEEGLAYMVRREMPRQPMVQRMPRAIISAW